MEKISLDPSVLATLGAFGHQIELCDLTGRAVGWFVPIAGPQDYDGYECPLSEAELDKIRQIGGGRPLVDIKHDLERLP